MTRSLADRAADILLGMAGGIFWFAFFLMMARACG